jgi:hypothetical protein
MTPKSEIFIELDRFNGFTEEPERYLGGYCGRGRAWRASPLMGKRHYSKSRIPRYCVLHSMLTTVQHSNLRVRGCHVVGRKWMEAVASAAKPAVERQTSTRRFAAPGEYARIITKTFYEAPSNTQRQTTRKLEVSVPILGLSRDPTPLINMIESDHDHDKDRAKRAGTNRRFHVLAWWCRCDG